MLTAAAATRPITLRLQQLSDSSGEASYMMSLKIPPRLHTTILVMMMMMKRKFV